MAIQSKDRINIFASRICGFNALLLNVFIGYGHKWIHLVVLSIVHFTLKMASKRAFNLCVAIILTSSFSLRFILKWSLLSHMCNARAWQKFMASTVFDDKSLFYGILRNFSTRWWHLNDFFFAFRSSLFFAVSLFILPFINARLK